MLCLTALIASPFVALGLDPRAHTTSHPHMSGYVYILASKPRGTLYVGVTSDLVRRVWEHRENTLPGFTRKYRVKMLVYYEVHATVPLAIQREKTSSIG